MLVVIVLEVAENVAVAEPARTVTLEGVVTTEGFELESVMAVFELAGADRVTVPVDVLPPIIEAGLRFKVNPEVTGLTVSMALPCTLPFDAPIVICVLLETAVVETVKVADAEPAGIEIILGTVPTAVLELDRLILVTVLDVGDIVTVPVELEPPVTDAGLSDTVTVLPPTGVTVILEFISLAT